jgi:hypothetical protein
MHTVSSALPSWRSRVVWPLLVIGLAGCAGFVPQTGPAPDPGGRYVPLTTPFIAVGDTQEHLATGYPMHDNDSAVDAFVEVAQRPPEQPLFGRRIIEWVLQEHPGEPFIHLGDLLDLSCRIEAVRIGQILRAAPNEGVILPGNHDGLMFGIYGYNVFEAATDSGVKKWHRACRRGAAPDDDTHRTANEAFTKRDFIAEYVKGQATWLGAKPGLPIPSARGFERISWRNPDPNALLSAIEAQLIDGAAYADSFLLQRIRLPKAPGAPRDVTVIALDTNQAGVLVNAWDTVMGRSPGSIGHVHPDQVEVVNRWVGEAIDRGELVVFAGHHNWQSLGLPSRTLLRSVMSRLNHPLVYLSAHTHSGFWAEHRVLDRQPLLELNVSSLSDWPIAYRRISFAYDESAKRVQVRGDLMPHRDTPNQSYADLLAAWEAQTCARTGLPVEEVQRHDREVVQQQRESRGSLIGWLLGAIDADCENCEHQALYEHAQAYQDAMLNTLLQASASAHNAGVSLSQPKLPEWCGVMDFAVCAVTLLVQKPVDFKSQVDLFRRKAGLVAAINDSLDRIDDPKAKAYMTCRAVQAAKIDFDATPDERNEHRSEDKRRLEQFFRIEAGVGMD